MSALPVSDVYPRRIPDLFSGNPVVVTGRYTAPATGTIRLVAKRAGNPYTREIPVTFPSQNQDNDILQSLWAREKIDDLMSQDWAGLQRGNMRDDLRQQITQLGLDYRLMTQFTSFVAVEERVVTDGGTPKRIQVPVELAEGVQYEEGWSGANRDRLMSSAKLAAPAARVVGGAGGGVPGGQIGGVVGGVVSPSRSSGTGSGGGIGSGSGPGIGPGYGGGFGGGAFRVGGGVTAPRAVYAPEPQYSEEARKANLQGTVVMAAIIASDGRPTELRILRSLGMGLDEKALEAVRNWKFEPALKDGKPVAVQVNLEVAFANGVAKTTLMTSGGGGTKPPAPMPPRRIDTKLHPRLIAAYDCWRTQPDKTKAPSACNLEGDKLLVQVILSLDSATALKELKAIGFEPLATQPRQKHLIGRVGVEQLPALADISIVQFVAPVSGGHK